MVLPAVLVCECVPKKKEKEENNNAKKYYCLDVISQRGSEYKIQSRNKKYRSEVKAWAFVCHPIISFITPKRRNYMKYHYEHEES